MAASRSTAPAAIAAPRRWTKSSPTNIDSQPIDRAIPTTDGRLKPVASKRRASAHHVAAPRLSAPLEAEPAAERRDESFDGGRIDDECAHPLGAEQPFLGGHGVQVGAEVLDPEADRAGRLRAVDDHDGASVVGDVGDGPDRHDGTGGPQDVRDRDEARVGGDRGVEGGDRPRVVTVVAGVDERDLHAGPVAQRVQRPDPARVLVGGRHRAATRAPVGEQRRGVHPVRRRVGQRDRPDVRTEDGGDPGARLAHAAHELGEVVGVSPAHIAFVGGHVGHRGGRLGGERARRTRC